MRESRRWTRSEDRALALKVAGGVPYRAIASELDRPYHGVKNRVKVLFQAGVLRKEWGFRDGARIRNGIITKSYEYEVADIRLIDELHRQVEARWVESHGSYTAEEDAIIIEMFAAGAPIGKIAARLTAITNRSRNARSVTGRLIRLREEGRVGYRIDPPPFAGEARPVWAPEEEQVLRFLAAKRIPYDLIAFCLDRPFDQVAGKIKRLGLHFRNHQEGTMPPFPITPGTKPVKIPKSPEPPAPAPEGV
ncbi:hypothetical protein [Magnetospirillum sp. UT-4]|uniref:hypothetical protein n=1 Tax=Magnetospirillum sp. UT-4 TaxID=2681467 RepID=UPI00138249F3|nr:hypothetical protein [Magnetospirillum sp. UT-4]CAA7621199.1 hypothetical protein MTBUT4_380040 [Magnetospirillum sp. UT-4]